MFTYKLLSLDHGDLQLSAQGAPAREQRDGCRRAPRTAAKDDSSAAVW
jgi:hypothetical protein